jgi:uncharacterized protein (DUF983 family)
MRLKAIFGLRCPHCLQGRVFHGWFRMNPTCTVCGVQFEREQGYFMMAVFVGYVMSFFIAVPALVVVYFTLRPSPWGYLWWTLLILLLAMPFIFHYARVVWMHLDELMDPRR